MGDSFTLGRGAKGHSADPAPKHASSRRVRGSSSLGRSRLVWGVIAGAVAVVVVGGLLTFMGGAGQEIGADNQTMVEQVGAAQDVQAELTATQSVRNAMQVYAASGSFTDVTPEALAAAEPSFRYVAGASGDPNTVSVAVADGGVGLAVRSSSGTCLYAFVQASTTTYGTGATCTGEAATAATDPSWPSG